MARPLRIEYPGAFYHVYCRGLERRQIFRDQYDYEKFLEILTQVWESASFICHAYCLMPNHDHLYLETPSANLSKIMQEVNGRYTQSFNRRYKRVGPLFQGRYKAKLIDQDSYSLQVSRYIHLNPVKAGLANHPGKWKGSSYRAFMGSVKSPAFLETKWLLKQVGDRKAFERYTMAGIKDPWNPLEPSGHGPVLGTELFVKKIQERLSGRKKDSSLTGLRELKKGERLKDIEDAVLNLTCEDPLKKKLLMYGLRRYTELSLKEVCERVQAKSPLAVTQTVRRLVLDAGSNKRIQKLLDQVKCHM